MLQIQEKGSDSHPFGGLQWAECSYFEFAACWVLSLLLLIPPATPAIVRVLTGHLLQDQVGIFLPSSLIGLERGCFLPTLQYMW